MCWLCRHHSSGMTVGRNSQHLRTCVLLAAAQLAQQVVEGEPGKRALIHAAQNLDIAVLKLRGRAHQN